MYLSCLLSYAVDGSIFPAHSPKNTLSSWNRRESFQWPDILFDVANTSTFPAISYFLL